jgi:Ca-activated chloride channel family protein
MQLFRFANPDYLYLLLLLPVAVLLFIIELIRKNRALSRLGDKNLIVKLVPELSRARTLIKFILQVIVILSVVIMLARPQFGSKIEDVKKQGVEVIIALDVSNSMLGKTGNLPSG